MAAMNIPMDTGDKTPEEIAEHEKAMVDKVEKAGVNEKPINPDAPKEEPEATVKPDSIPDKFWDVEKGEVRIEAMAKSYAELEKGQSTPEGDKDKAEEDDDKTKAEGEKEASGDLAPFEEVRAAADAEYQNTGSLTEDTYDVLAKRGFSKAMVDQYIAGAEAQSDANRNAIFEKAGVTVDDFTKASAWAADNLSEADIKNFNSALTNEEASVFAVQGLMAKYQKEADIDPNVNLSGGSSNTSAGLFRSRAEMVAAMSDKRYKTDAHYREEVAQKIAGAGRANIDLFA